MLTAIISQTTVNPAPKTNTDDAPACCVSQPPSAPPQNKPNACKVLYTPNAVPRAAVGAIRDTRKGSISTKILNPKKNANSSMTRTSQCVVGCDSAAHIPI